MHRCLNAPEHFRMLGVGGGNTPRRDISLSKGTMHTITHTFTPNSDAK